MTKAQKSMNLLMALVLIIFCFAGCSSGSKNGITGDTVNESADSYSYSNESDYESVTEDSVLVSDRKIIYNADLVAETKDFDAAKDNIDALISKYGGYLEYADVSGNSYEDEEETKRLNYTIRVKAEDLDAFLDEISLLVNLTSNSKSTDDVTDSYIDTEARLESLQQEEEKLLSLLDMAENLTEVLELEDKLTDVRYEIESMQRILKSYDAQISYSTVTLYLTDVNVYTSEQSFGERMVEALGGGWKNFVSVLEELLVAIVWMFPFLLMAGVIVVIIVAFSKKRAKKRRTQAFQFPAVQAAPPTVNQATPAETRNDAAVQTVQNSQKPSNNK